MNPNADNKEHADNSQNMVTNETKSLVNSNNLNCGENEIQNFEDSEKQSVVSNDNSINEKFTSSMSCDNLKMANLIPV